MLAKPLWYHFFADTLVFSFRLIAQRQLSVLPNVLSTSMMNPAGEQARRIAQLTNYFFIAASFVLLVVTVLTVLFLYKFRAKAGDAEPKQIKRNVKVELVMVGVPLAMVVFFFFLTVKTMRAVLPQHHDRAPDVIVTGHQWWWEVQYPLANVTTANEVHLPVGKPVLVELKSADVIHDWWVPELGNKMDMIPDRENFLWITVHEAGYYQGACSEFCGTQHAWMRIQVYADSDTDFNNFITSHQPVAQTPTSPLAQTGERIFNTMTCGDCHRINGTAANGDDAPDLTHFASRRTMLTGMLPNDARHVHQFLANPQAVKSGVHMPNFALDDTSQNALVAYLTQLK